MNRNDMIPALSDDTTHHHFTEFEIDDHNDVDAWGNEWDIDDDEIYD